MVSVKLVYASTLPMRNSGSSSSVVDTARSSLGGQTSGQTSGQNSDKNNDRIVVKQRPAAAHIRPVAAPIRPAGQPRHLCGRPAGLPAD